MSAEMAAEALARSFHHTYERLSAGYEWQTQESCRVEFDDLPPQNRALMLAVCQQIYAEYFMPLAEENERLKAGHREDVERLVAGNESLSAEVATLTRQLQEAEDMANVGRSLMEQIESNAESLRGWAPLCDPAEIVVDLINQRDEAERQLQEAVEERDRLLWIVDAFYGGWIGRNNAGQLNRDLIDRALDAARAAFAVQEARALTERSKS